MSINFKEKFESTKNAVSKKWKEANDKYPWLKPVLIGCGIGVAGYGIYRLDKKMHLEVHTLETETANTFLGTITNSKGAGSLKLTEPAGHKYYNYFYPNHNNESDMENPKLTWERLYKDNWDEVVECAKRLNLHPGEIFVIEDQTSFINDPDYPNMDPTMPIVSHLINNVGVYPPEE